MARTLWLGLLSCLGAAGPSVARADWQFTKWGMTPDQVVAASGGTAHLLPSSQRPKVATLETAASGEFTDDGVTLRTVFSFATGSGGLSCLFYGVSGHDGDAALKALLMKRYGPPASVSGLPAIGQETLNWKTDTDSINASFSPDDPAYVEHCANRP